MNRFFCIVVSVFCSVQCLVAQETTTESKSGIPMLIGFSYVPKNIWGVYSIIGQKQFLKYDFDANSMTTWEGSLTGRKIPIKVGVNAQFENNVVGKVYKFSGYLGFKRTFIRIQSGKLSGTANWTGGVIPNYISKFPFNYRYTNIDLLLSLKKSNTGANYIGLGYTSLKVPIQVNTLVTASNRENQKYGATVFDKEFSIKAYSFLFGFDLMQQEAITKKRIIAKNSKSGFGVFAATQDKVGFGMSYMTDAAVKKAEELNPGKTSVGSDLFTGFVEYQISVGPKWSANIGTARLILGVGYEFSGALVASLSGAATDSKDLGYDPSLFYYRHGVIFRAFFSW